MTQVDLHRRGNNLDRREGHLGSGRRARGAGGGDGDVGREADAGPRQTDQPPARRARDVGSRTLADVQVAESGRLFVRCRGVDEAARAADDGRL